MLHRPVVAEQQPARRALVSVLERQLDLVLDIAAGWLGVYYPPMVLLILLVAMVFVASICFSVIVSRQRQQIERLIEETAILSAELRDARAARAPRESEHVAG